MKHAEGPQGCAAKPAKKREGVEPHPISLCTHDDGRKVLLARRSRRRREVSGLRRRYTLTGRPDNLHKSADWCNNNNRCLLVHNPCILF